MVVTLSLMIHRTLPVLAAVVLLAACTPAGGEEPTPSPDPTPTVTSPAPPSPTPSPEPTTEEPSPTPTEIQSFPPAPEGESDEIAAIREGWEEYNRVKEKFAKDPTLKDLTETQYVTTGFAAQMIIEQISSLRKDNLRVVGDRIWRDVTITEPSTNADGVTIATVTACYDPTHAYAVDIDTEEPSKERLTKTLRETLLMEQGADKIWRVADYDNESEEC